MDFTTSERNIILVSLDHMEEHLHILFEAGDITLDTFNLRMNSRKTAYQKIKLVEKYGKSLIDKVIKIDDLTPEEIKDCEYLEDRIITHLEWSKIG
jgi:hypothetical protein